MIAQEVMTFKAQKQGLSLNTAGATNLKRKESMSANDREALARSKDVAASSKDSHRNSSSIASTAVPEAHNDIRQHMDVDALERELGGGV